MRAMIIGWKNKMSDGHPGTIDDLTFTGNRVIVWVHATPVSSEGRVFDLDGRQLGVLGPPRFAVLVESGGWHVGGSSWAFKGEVATLVTYDSHDGKQATYDLKPLTTGDNWAPELLALAGTRDRIVVVMSGFPPVVGVIDRRSGRVERIAPPSCK
jgi:hypothetical protein